MAYGGYLVCPGVVLSAYHHWRKGGAFMCYESCFVSQVLRHDSSPMYRISQEVKVFGLIILSYSLSMYSGLAHQIQSAYGKSALRCFWISFLIGMILASAFGVFSCT
ncbi:hypothetical protein QBC42DRAFT_279881 [Cladorrhinum samala]|uniref:Uncharacterized protein n=1 Tax=Cladorrhinum samala TaxID=585594 RepID=A0AAV9H8N2_9PEZI|nr:hypothetical protein QBC42DRAFT_279881 [Cladorrhinum samala]